MKQERYIVKLITLVFIAISAWTSLSGQSTFLKTYTIDTGGGGINHIYNVFNSEDNHYLVSFGISGVAKKLAWLSDLVLCTDSTGTEDWIIGFPYTQDMIYPFYSNDAFEHGGIINIPDYADGRMGVLHYYSDGSIGHSIGDILPFGNNLRRGNTRYDANHWIFNSMSLYTDIVHLICSDAEGDTLWTKSYPDSVQDISSGVRVDQNRFMFTAFNVNGNFLMVTDNQGNIEQTIPYPPESENMFWSSLSSEADGRVLIAYKDSTNIVQFDMYEDNSITSLYTMSVNSNAYTGNFILDGNTIVYTDSSAIRKIDFTGNEMWHLDFPPHWGGGILLKTPDNNFLYAFYDYNSISLLKCTNDGVPVSDNISPRPRLELKNYPNPFSGQTTISYNLPEKGLVNLTIYNLKGQLVKHLVQNEQKTGNYSIIWNGRNESGVKTTPGIYILHLRTGNRVTSKKLLMLH